MDLISVNGVLATYLGACRTVYVSPTGSDSNDGGAAHPVQSLNRAYRLAKPGNTVQVACGDYPAQQINYDPAKARSISYVTFQPAAPGVCWNQTDGITIGKQDTSGPSYLILRRVAYNGGIGNYQANDVGPTKDLATTINYPSNHITIDGQNGGRWSISGADSILIENSDFGKCRSNKITVDGAGVLAECSPSFSASSAGHRPSNVVVRHSKIHDISMTTGNPECGADNNCHVSAIEFKSANGVTINGDLFYNNEITDMRIQNRDGSPAGEMRNITIENSWFGLANTYAAPQTPIQVDSEVDGLTIRFNSFTVAAASNGAHSGYIQCRGASMDTNSGGTSCGVPSNHAKVYGNIMASAGCPTDTDRSYNIIVPFSNNPPYNSVCDPTETIVSSVPYTSDPAPGGGAPNFSITGRLWIGDNHIPAVATQYPRTDFFGKARLVYRNRLDVGAVQRNKEPQRRPKPKPPRRHKP